MKAVNSILYFAYELLESLSYFQRLLCHAKNRKPAADCARGKSEIFLKS